MATTVRRTMAYSYIRIILNYPLYTQTIHYVYAPLYYINILFRINEFKTKWKILRYLSLLWLYYYFILLSSYLKIII